MSIPHPAQDSPSVPPPLPPPTHLYEDLTPQAQQKEWNFFNKEYLDQHWTDFDPCDSDEAKLSGYRCGILPFFSCQDDRMTIAI